MLEFDTSLTGESVVNLLEFAVLVEGAPKAIQIDNGPEFICMALDKWAYSKGVSLYFSRPGEAKGQSVHRIVQRETQG